MKMMTHYHQGTSETKFSLLLITQHAILILWTRNTALHSVNSGTRRK